MRRRITAPHPSESFERTAPMATIAVLGALDTHGAHHQFLADHITQHGHRAILVDVGIGGTPQINPHISRENVSELKDLDWRVFRKDQAGARRMMLEAAPRRLLKLLQQKRIHGIIALGSGEAEIIGRAALRALPIGFPKLMLSLSNEAPQKGTELLEDTVQLPCPLDLSHLNRLTRPFLTRAAGAICGMVDASATPSLEDPPVIFASVFGNTTIGVESASHLLEDAGFEVMHFPATGKGGRTMEALIQTGVAAGVLDFTTTELADEIVGGFLSAGPTRMDAAAARAVPSVLVPGCLDMVNFFAPNTVPERFAGRTFHHHNPSVTLLRTNAEEAALIGRRFAEKANAYSGKVSVLVPLLGTSAISSPGFAFHDPKADAALFSAIRKGLRPQIRLIEIQATINDSAFAEACARALLENIQAKADEDAARPY